ncbi:glucose-6-phosphate 1-dehydrogenase [Oleiphilus messinensis]|uniref:Glucose-6-phosphate 1-dehydrogenase n=1 Tax=Oleiphilus messinensis TaxID=141451 RepID=A0A1Y0II59_9GAMM|nr:glucose-6-phosphate dehydrogenase [Oleiphilus messinensis]ARU59113.1 glucose-6-phosphate 1-dehydrogenase [Oleiphilus messinensis]
MDTGSKREANSVFVMFGALGDLARRKLFPALYQLQHAGLLEDNCLILGVSLEDMDEEKFREEIRSRLDTFVKGEAPNPDSVEKLLAKLSYVAIDLAQAEDYAKLATALQGIQYQDLILYYATPPALYAVISEHLSNIGVVKDNTRVVVEKPIGHDYASSTQINNHLAQFFRESQIYRIDHYLGKETVQNLIALRFANSLFESQWDHNHISHVEINVAESVGIEGRWGYFDKAGQLRDMVQNHLLQLLCLIAMDPPSDLSADSIRDEKVKVLKALKPIPHEHMDLLLVRGRYARGIIEGKVVPGYLEEEGANELSQTETFVAFKAEIANWRWAGVPFYLRTGKRLPEKLSQIIVHFKPAAHYIFDPDQKRIAHNKLMIRLQPDEGISLQVLTKDQGLDKGMRLRQGPLQLNFSQAFQAGRIPDAYERLLWEVLKGNQYLFVRRDEVECAWKWCDQLIAGWEKLGIQPKKYPAGSWGPASAITLIARDGLSWHEDL